MAFVVKNKSFILGIEFEYKTGPWEKVRRLDYEHSPGGWTMNTVYVRTWCEHWYSGLKTYYVFASA